MRDRLCRYILPNMKLRKVTATPTTALPPPAQIRTMGFPCMANARYNMKLIMSIKIPCATRRKEHVAMTAKLNITWRIAYSGIVFFILQMILRLARVDISFVFPSSRIMVSTASYAQKQNMPARKTITVVAVKMHSAT